MLSDTYSIMDQMLLKPSRLINVLTLAHSQDVFVDVLARQYDSFTIPFHTVVICSLSLGAQESVDVSTLLRTSVPRSAGILL